MGNVTMAETPLALSTESDPVRAAMANWTPGGVLLDPKRRDDVQLGYSGVYDGLSVAEAEGYVRVGGGAPGGFFYLQAAVLERRVR